jgi:hypothetical protein
VTDRAAGRTTRRRPFLEKGLAMAISARPPRQVVGTGAIDLRNQIERAVTRLCADLGVADSYREEP